MNRKVTIVIEDAEGGFSLLINSEPPLPIDGTVPEPSAALIAGMVARRAIEELVQSQAAQSQAAQSQAKPDDQN